MKELFSQNLIDLARSLPEHLYVVGGRVRDYLADLYTEKPDTDICAPLDAETFARIAEDAGFKAEAVYKNTGTVKLTCGGEEFEYTCFRSDEYIRGEHVPANTFFTNDIVLDARRRDFKCNAVYYDLTDEKIVDPLGGVEDIDNRRMTTVAPAEKVFGEDGLRLMRLARIAAQTGFLPTAECLEGAKVNAPLIKDISAERIFAELCGILHADEKYSVGAGQYTGLKILQRTGVLNYILPELTLGEGMVQNKKFHKYDVLEHSLRCAGYADGEIRFAALLHDAGKPFCFKTNSNYIGHEDEGARIAEEILKRLKAPKKLIEETVKLVELHMYDFRCDAKENKVRKFILENYGLFDKILMLKQADYSACRDDFGCAPSVVKLKRIYEKMKDEGVPFTLKTLHIRGDKLLAAGFPAEGIGNVLNRLLGDCAINLVENDEEKLLTRAQKVYLAALNPEAYAVFKSKN